jgi:tuberculosinol/isotuberculosinol synthase
MNAEDFARLSRTEIAQILSRSGSRVCVFPLKGTRRWFTLEHPTVPKQDFAPAYLHATSQRSIELYALIFDHGLNTLLIPSFSPDVMARGDAYMRMAAEGLTLLATHPHFLGFYKAYGVRVRFYGDYRRFFDPTPYAYLSDLFDELTELTLAHDQRRIFFGLFAHDPTEAVASLAIRHYLEHGAAPDKRTLIEMYYGECIESVDLFIGFGKFRAFDVPLVTTGREDLYFTVNPSLYLTERQLREILYDHLYARTRTVVDLEPEETLDALHTPSSAQNDTRTGLQPETWAFMRDVYQANLGRTLGVGRKDRHSGYWYPLPQVELPVGYSAYAEMRKHGDAYGFP